MPIIICNVEEQRSLEREPYLTLGKKIKSFKGNFDSQEIELNVGSSKEGFGKGFFSDREYVVDPKLNFAFGKTKDAETGAWRWFVKMTYSFECTDSNFHYYQRHIKLLKKRIPYFYIASASHFSFASHLDDRFELEFDVLVEDQNNILQVCYSLLNQIITIFSFED